MIRTFICIELSDSVKDELALVINEIKHIRTVKWVKPQNIHLTLKFLGDVDTELISTIKDAVDKAAQHFDKFDINLAQFGAFPHFKRPRVYWVGLKDSSKKLGQLHAAIEKEMEQIGFSREQRRFSPHLTLGRVKSDQHSRELGAFFQQQQSLSTTLTVNEVVVMKSELTPAGSIYTPMNKIKLGQN